MNNIQRMAAVAIAAASLTTAIGTASAQAQIPQGTTGGWAIVAPSGRLGHNSNVLSSTHVSQGVYRVKFNQSVTNCATNATLAGRGKNSLAPGYVVISHDKDNADTIQVNTFLTTTLIPADFRFNMIVMC